ncbi:MAG: hypothetical protein QNJ97_13785 [Myxococcota bacterium]|nr:hypothetical protein [Myxococcota bacterium]
MMPKRERVPVSLVGSLCFIALAVFPAPLLSANNGATGCRLAVIAMPRGSSREAGVARAVIPKKTTAKCQLIMVEEMVARVPTDRTVTIPDDIQAQIDRAKQAALQFDLSTAARLWREAASATVQSDMVVLHPSIVVETLIAAGAASIDAGEQDTALLYYRKALSLDSDARPGPSISPQAQAFFAAGRNAGPILFPVPPPARLRTLAKQWQVEGILWISAGRDEEGLILSEKISLVKEATTKPQIRHRLPFDIAAQERWLAGEQRRLQIRVRQACGIPQEVTKPPPWYKKWWVYAIAGGVVAAGTAIAIAATATADPGNVDVVVYH